ncbi:MAG: photosystem I assembly BtpA [Candidatus Kerfeldbacteria bacterium CG15_BIG_FIL_POST_REV_8_21_14_020_45_12]|uniref:Photosystem I assembly BtpA n=1 Tax=Candidatus Kerfeldbacteria bacterium CG15_BIG_FIL_POST_REV_8_21_14_020_45_12 TaxID=2014247 RepID=A0A2M7H4R0_9BACT|nr:MAG: photosystem I assembly BtpA [Candidatus Kerfeldbacteria bacterium CG15_BIG_FIL_POST_REV_8_21_14_020_45_12]PJA93378.1 MAG: photosystem I assembly BtpA [Candidatus Kerfeldbacteria bacterium CG_4_9_14_3_um_filter_45_8]
MKIIADIFGTAKPVIGMVHLQPSVGYPGHPGMDNYIAHAVKTAKSLVKGGVHGILVENEFDRPHSITVSPEVEACILEVTKAISSAVSVPVGVDVLLNDWRASLNIAKTAGCAFVRIDVFVDHVTCKWGEIEPEADKIIEYREQIGAENIALFTDIQVKHKRMLNPEKLLTQSADEARAAGADAVIVTGAWTGEETPIENVKLVQKHLPGFPVMIGAGITLDNIHEQFSVADGAIVGTSLKNDDGEVDREKVSALLEAISDL